LQSDKQAKKLKEGLEVLCQASSVVDNQALLNLGIDQAKIKSFLPQLQANIKTCAQLIDQTLLNLKPLLLSNVGANDSPAAANSLTATAAANSNNFAGESTANSNSNVSSSAAATTTGNNNTMIATPFVTTAYAHHASNGGSPLLQQAANSAVPLSLKEDAKNDIGFKKTSCP